MDMLARKCIQGSLKEILEQEFKPEEFRRMGHIIIEDGVLTTRRRGYVCWSLSFTPDR